MAPETALPDFIDVNILPERYRPRKLPRRAIILSLVAAILAILILPLYLVSAAMGGDIANLEAEILSVQGDLARISTPAPEVLGLMDTLTQTQKSAGELEEARSTIAADRADWPAVMAAIGNYNADQLALDSLTQADRQITLKGRAIDKPVVDAYADNLKASDLFSSVNLQSIKAAATPFVPVTPTETITPGVTITPTETITPGVTITPTVAITPVGPDEYEIDDFQARDIILGQTQLHNFYPIYDVDKVKFLAKAGRYYRVYTSDLAPAVDTLLEVNVAGQRYTNDDCYPGSGDLSSCVEFHVGTGYDVEATVKITNRGQFGPEMWYSITVEEISPTPTPIPTATPIPPTATPIPPTPVPPTPTPIPPTLTPTPDLRDIYEPDYTIPKPIGVAEAQTHNFYPGGDVDKVTFGVKSGRLYAVNTFNLVPGVDTRIVVELNGEVCPDCQNDDATDQFLESEVRFVPTIDGVAVATISNVKNSQYGPDKTYDLTLSLLSSLVDNYEPDDPFAKPIAMEGTQEHSFYPEGDRDLVKFMVKEGRYYAVYTSNLALGVDTGLKVVLEDQVMGENDDYDPGTGNFASAVCFQTPRDGTAVAIITNLQPQYAVDKTYEINVNESPILDVSPARLEFTAVMGEALPRRQEFYITNISGGLLDWKATKDASWLIVSAPPPPPPQDPYSGIAPSTRYVSVDITGLTMGTYVGHIYITGLDPCCVEPCQRMVTVILQVTSPGIWISPSAVHSKCGEEAGHPATNFIDGNTTTYWEHGVDESHWIVLDLGQVWYLPKIRVYVDGTVASDWHGVEVYVSKDAITWGSPVGRDMPIAGAPGWHTLDVTGKSGRYIKLADIETSRADGLLRGYEFEAFIAPTTSSSLRPPGMASFARHGSPDPGQQRGFGNPLRAILDPLSLSTRGDGMASGLLSPEPVEFVIVLELKMGATESP